LGLQIILILDDAYKRPNLEGIDPYFLSQRIANISR
jgi:hypothetical protein